ncbi:hypothetical protein KCP70_04915 [Salmonella enterica subsp. enterica]|nr:hypothetical protein KCP70_04915 [Salmonella enterica subsp. enterica]
MRRQPCVCVFPVHGEPRRAGGAAGVPEMNQDQVKRLSTLVAQYMSMCLDAPCG